MRSIGQHWIGGEPVSGEPAFATTSSASGELVCKVPSADAATVDAAVAAALQAFRRSGWAETTGQHRATVLLALADRLDGAVDEIADLVAHEVGMPVRLAREFEVAGAADKLRYFAGLARELQGAVTGASPVNVLDLTVPYPVGVCALISPWNNPIEQPVRQLGAALAAGCTVVIKPSERTPASTEALVRLCQDLPGLPVGVVNLVHGPGQPTGEALTTHPDVAKVAFTGSTATGQRIMRGAARTLKRVSLECGGKTPCLVFPDADLDGAVAGLALGSFLFTGQSCSAATRIIVQRDCYQPFLDAFTAQAARITVGDPFDPATAIGPLVSEEHAQHVRHYLEGVSEDGGTIAAGGRVDGLYAQPTVVTGMRPDSKIATQEVFGPVVCVFEVEDEDEAVDLANAVPFGLQASVWTSDLNRALRVSRELEVGDVWINAHYLRQAETPFGGWKESGIGRELGMAGVQEYLRYKRLAFDSAAAAPKAIELLEPSD